MISDISRINTQVSPRNPLGLSRLDTKNMQIKENKVRSRYLSQSSSSEEDQSSVHIQRSSNPSRALSDQDQPQHNPDPLFIGKLPWLTYPLNILDLPYPRETMPRSSTSVLGLDDKKGQQELRPRGPSSMLPLSISHAFDKFEHDCLASNLPEGKYIKPPPSTANW